MKDWNNKFHEYRIKRGYSQKQIAELIGISLPSVIQADRTGLNRSAAETVYKMAQLFHCLMEDLMDEDTIDEVDVKSVIPARKVGRPRTRKTDSPE